MFEKIKEYLRIKNEKRQIIRVIKLAYNLIYSEKYDLSIDKDVELFKTQIKLNCKSDIKILQSFAVINPILYNKISITEIDLNIFVNLIEEIQNKKRNEEILSLELQREELKLIINLMIINNHIKTGKKEFSKNQYSYRGILYRIENAKKSPATQSEKNEIKNISSELEFLNDEAERVDKELNKINEELKKYEN